MFSSASRVAAAPVQLVALDLDGTLLRDDKRLSRSAVRAISRVRSLGVRVVLASARPPRSVRRIYEYLELDTLQINYNGALIHDPSGGEPLYHRPLAADLACQIIAFVRRLEPALVIGVESLDRAERRRAEQWVSTAPSWPVPEPRSATTGDLLQGPVTKLTLLGAGRALSGIRGRVRQRFAGRIRVAAGTPNVMHIVHPEVDKSTALQRVAQCYGVGRRSVMAIGDAPNDVGMLRWAGLGVAMENAWDATRSAADTIVPSNEDDGVAYALDHFVG